MKGKVAVITGGSGTLGKAITKGLASNGAIVYMLNRNIVKAEEVALDMRNQGMQVFAFQCDVLDEVSMQNAVDYIVQRESKVDILINGAGGNRSGATIMPHQTIFDININEFRQVNELNLLGTVIPTIAFLRPMVAQKYGCIVNISSMAAQIPLTRVMGYSASKAAIDNFTKSMAVEVQLKYGEGIRVNALAPGFLVAEQNKALLLNEDGTLTDRGNTIISQTPMKRFGKPEELISTILWLCDDKSSFVTGIVVPVDGGFSAFSGV